MITEEQITYFQTFGFLVLKQAFQPDEMDAISQKFDELLDKERDGQPPSGRKPAVALRHCRNYASANGPSGG